LVKMVQLNPNLWSYFVSPVFYVLKQLDLQVFKGSICRRMCLLLCAAS
jgi:hypothetical protein